MTASAWMAPSRADGDTVRAARHGWESSDTPGPVPRY